jgi:phosphinothricin acetyltransferase
MTNVMHSSPSASPEDLIIRPAVERDLPRLTEIYNHYVVNTPTTFDTDPFTVDDRRDWFSHYTDTSRHRLLVAEIDGHVAGYMSSSRYHPRAAYDTTVEATILCAPEWIGRGIGRPMYAALFDALRDQDIHSIVALVTLPNKGSCAIHEHFSFEVVGTIREAGRKFDRYWDVIMYQRLLAPKG